MLSFQTAYAQTPPITPSGLNTQVNLSTTPPAGKVQYNITGGTRPGGGASLFHSFGEFGVPNNHIANFLNETGIPTSNILGRVTGENISNIFGTIQTNGVGGFGNANLFLINPAGFLFGPGATVNVGGMVTFTSANYLRLTDGGRFNASLNPVVPDLLTAAPVAAFGFLGSNPGAITFQGSQFSVAEGMGISLVGGNITIQSGLLDDGVTTQPTRLSAPGGQINLASVISPGEVVAVSVQPAPTMTLGSIELSQGSALDVSGNAGGTVRIRSGEFVIDNATLSADTVNANGSPIAVDIQLTGDFSITADLNPAITARTTGSGNAGDIQISSASLNVTASVAGDFLSVIDSHTSGAGKGGNVSITATDTLTVTGDPSSFALFFIDSGTTGLDEGQGGNVTLNARNVDLQFASISTGDTVGGIVLGEETSGSGGNVTIMADSLLMTAAGITTDAFFNGRAGDITLSVRDLQAIDSQFSLTGLTKSGTFNIMGDSARLDGSQVLGGTGLEPGGGISIAGRVVELKNGSTVASQAFGDADAGSIIVTATEKLIMSDDPATDGAFLRPSGLFTNSFGNAGIGTLGNGGTITVVTPRLQMTDGTRIDSTTQSGGHGGPITITADWISISGERPTPAIEEFFGLGGLSSGIYSRTIGTDPGSGSGGNITLNAGQSVTISEGAQVSASTTGPGNAGNITIQGLASPAQSVVIDGSGSGVFTDTQAAGAGGNIFVNADSVTLSNGSTLSATTSGSGHAGDIRVVGEEISLTGLSSNISAITLGDGNAGNILLEVGQLTMTDEANVLASTQGAGHGGNITIHGLSGSGSVAENVVLNGLSTLDTTSILGSGPAGNVRINAARLTVANESQITSSSQQGSGPAGNVILDATESITIAGGFAFSASLVGSTGNGGQVTITTPSLTIDAGATGIGGSVSTNTSGAGQAGDVTINTSTLSLSNGGQLTSNSSILGLAIPTGSGGTVTVRGLQASGSQANSVTISGSDNFGNQSGIFTKTEGTGKGGNISLNANTVTLQNGSEISSSSAGSGTAGNIDLTANNQLTMSNSSITTEATKSSGGIIKITTDPSGTVELSNSTISASVLDGTGGGGSVSIDPQFVILQNSQILAEAEQGPGGNILINITNGGLFLPDATSKVSASSQFGQQGTVTIQAPIAPAGGKIQPLGKAPIQVTALLSQRCAAIARGEVSSFVMAGRDTLPTEPGGWLTSPLASVPTDSGLTVQAGNPAISSHLSDPMMLSLRRLPSSAKLAQSLSDDWLSDCGGNS